jgi:hypothetical protein
MSTIHESAHALLTGTMICDSTRFSVARVRAVDATALSRRNVRRRFVRSSYCEIDSVVVRCIVAGNSIGGRRDLGRPILKDDMVMVQACGEICHCRTDDDGC